MSQIISLDTHRRYSLGGVETLEGERVLEERIERRRGAIRDFLGRCEPGLPVAVETSGNWCRIVDPERPGVSGEMEQAGMVPGLVHARKARSRIAETNRSDRITVRGMNMLQHAKRLPTAWIPPRELKGPPRARADADVLL